MRLSIFALIAIFSSQLKAVEYQFSPQARVMTRVDDNIRGASNSPETAWGFDTSGSFDLRARTDTTSVQVSPRVNIRRFAVGDNLNADEYGLTLSGKWTGERTVAGLDFSYNRDSTLATEATDTGLKNDVKDRDNISVSPSLSYALTERLNGNVSFLYNDVSYINAQNSGLIDYQYIQGTTGLQYSLNESIQIFGNFYINNFDVASIRSSTRTYGGQSGVVWKWDDSLTATAAVGWEASTIDFVSVEAKIVNLPKPHLEFFEVSDRTDSDGPVASVTIEKTFESLVTKLDYSRMISPSGRGAQSSSDRIVFNATHHLTERLALALDCLQEMRVSQAESQTSLGTSSDLNRDYTEVRATVRYRVFREWALTGAYRFGHRKGTSQSNSDTADTNAVFFTIDYIGLPKLF